jgi:hypothetical protein
VSSPRPERKYVHLTHPTGSSATSRCPTPFRALRTHAVAGDILIESSSSLPSAFTSATA